MKVLMLPQPNPDKPGTSGIARVVEAYTKHLPEFGVELVHPDSNNYDLLALHVSDNHGLVDERPMVLSNHGLHWTADYSCHKWQYGVNQAVIDAIRKATAVTVPSAWVAETFQRDMRFTPHVVPHGIDWGDWQHDAPQGDYVLWNKNRSHDVCDPTPVSQLAHAHPREHFVTTFLPDGAPSPPNTNVIGLIPYDQMKQLVQSALVYLSTTKETWGIGTLEAMASGVPVLGYAHGGNVELVQHGTSGYLARPGDAEDLAEGLAYCLAHRNTLGANGRELARQWTWERACEMVARVYREALEPSPPTVGIVIPTYNKPDQQLRRALTSAIHQTYGPIRIVVVDDGSDDPTVAQDVISSVELGQRDVTLLQRNNGGVAIARNDGITACGDVKYVCCLDADDGIEERFIEVCVEALEDDRSLGIAYTRLYYVTPDGREGISDWPGEWDFDAHLRRQAQVPTCCVFRKDMWERLGGYRQRYAPTGAGEEDAEMWLRAGAYGWKAEKVTEEPLFVYSWQSGMVSGNRQHAVTDWTGWHPWVNDGQHPFASYATPKNGLSHGVRQFDEPQISVVIPVGPDHIKLAINALDSLEAQTFRKWECVLVDDTGGNDPDAWERLLTTYPYARTVDTWGPHGAGKARNMGADLARAPFLLFLDADDWLYPECMERMVAAWNEHQAIVYTDYVGKAIVSPSDLADDLKERLYQFNERTGEAVIGYRAFDYDCDLAQAQPQGERPYIWTNVTALIPRAWHQAVGGFDESLPSWEDVDYHWRMAKAGHCYHRISSELMVYNFHYGHRRERGRQTHQTLLDYLRDKHKEIEPMGCRGCGGRRGSARQATVVQGTAQTRIERMNDDDFVKVRYMGKGGKHQVTGLAVFDSQVLPGSMIRRSKDPPLWSIRYGGRSRGEVFRVHRDDVAQEPGKFVPVESEHVVSAPEVERVTEPPRPLVEDVPVEKIGEKLPLSSLEKLAEDAEETGRDTYSIKDGFMPPTDVPSTETAQGVVDSILSPGQAQQLSQPSLPSPLPMGDRHSKFDLQTLPGIGAKTAKQMQADGIDSREAVLELGEVGLQHYPGIGEAKARVIIAALEG